MIVVLQSVPLILEALKRLLGKELSNQIAFTSDWQVALNAVETRRGRGDRTVLVSSSVFRDGGVTGNIVALGAKELDPSAWVFIYSIDLDDGVSRFVDGYIPKPLEGLDMNAQVLEFLRLDFSTIGSLDELRRRLPWLKKI